MNMMNINYRTRVKLHTLAATIDLEIFGVKIFLLFTLATKIKNMKIYLQ